MTHCRKMFVWDPKVVNEQACRDSAAILIARDEERVEVHKHKSDENCAQGVFELLNTQQLLGLRDVQCYAFTKGTDVVSGR